MVTLSSLSLYSESSTPTSPGAKSDSQVPRKSSPELPKDSGANSGTNSTSSSKQGETQTTPTPPGSDQELKGAMSLPPLCPALVHGQKAVEVAKTDGKWPVVDLLVDKYAILSNNGKWVVRRVHVRVSVCRRYVSQFTATQCVPLKP